MNHTPKGITYKLPIRTEIMYEYNKCLNQVFIRVIKHLHTLTQVRWKGKNWKLQPVILTRSTCFSNRVHPLSKFLRPITTRLISHYPGKMVTQNLLRRTKSFCVPRIYVQMKIKIKKAEELTKCQESKTKRVNHHSNILQSQIKKGIVEKNPWMD